MKRSSTQSSRSSRANVSTEQHRIVVSGITVDIVRKDIKNLHVGVYPPNGRVRVAAPHRFDDDAIRRAIITRLRWIRRHQAQFKRQTRQSSRDMVTGESHYFQGRRYRLNVIQHPAPPTVIVRNKTTMELRVRTGTDRAKREAILNAWYRDRLRGQIPALLAIWQPRVGVTVNEVRIRRMKTRWGSCNPDAKRIWLNLELAKKSPASLEYILVHEMIHLLHRHHDKHFKALLDQVMPNWELRRHELNQTPLAHEDWTQ